MYLLGIKRMISPRFRSIVVALVGSGGTSIPNHHSKQEWIPVRGKKGRNIKKKFKTKVKELESFDLVFYDFCRGRVVIAGVTLQEKQACRHVPTPKSSNKTGNCRIKKRKNVKKK